MLDLRKKNQIFKVLERCTEQECGHVGQPLSHRGAGTMHYQVSLIPNEPNTPGESGHGIFNPSIFIKAHGWL